MNIEIIQKSDNRLPFLKGVTDFLRSDSLKENLTLYHYAKEKNNASMMAFLMGKGQKEITKFYTQILQQYLNGALKEF
jgi:hypothetical protein